MNFIETDKYLYLEYIPEEKRFGVFANKKIYKNLILGEYTGVVEFLNDNNKQF